MYKFDKARIFIKINLINNSDMVTCHEFVTLLCQSKTFINDNDDTPNLDNIFDNDANDVKIESKHGILVVSSSGQTRIHRCGSGC